MATSVEFIEFACEQIRGTGAVRYKKMFGEYKWTTARGTDKVKPIFWLSIWDGFFKVAFNFAENLKEELLNLPISRDTKKIIQNTEPMGKTMRFIPIILDVKSDSQLNDIYLLAEFRKIKVK